MWMDDIEKLAMAFLGICAGVLMLAFAFFFIYKGVVC